MNMTMRRWMRNPSRTLLWVQLLALLLYPFVGDSRAGQIVSTAISVGVLSAAVWMVHRSPRPGWIAGVLAAIGVGAWIAHNVTGSVALGALGASTLSVRQSSLDGWYLPIASIVPRLC